MTNDKLELNEKSGIDQLRHSIAREAVEGNLEQAETVVVGEGDTAAAIHCLKLDTDGVMRYDGYHRQYAYQGEIEAIVDVFEAIVDTEREEAPDDAPINWDRGVLAERDAVDFDIGAAEQAQ
jgi:hypothetical protein